MIISTSALATTRLCVSTTEVRHELLVGPGFPLDLGRTTHQKTSVYMYPPVIKHGVLENGPFIGDLPIETSIYRELSIAMFDYQRVLQISLGKDLCTFKKML